MRVRGCALAGLECQPPIEWHHVITKNRLKRQFPLGAWRERYTDGTWRPITRSMNTDFLDTKTLNLILGDKRNRVWLCTYHHELLTNARLWLKPPQSVWEFAADFGLTGQLENDVARHTPQQEEGA